LPVICGPLFPSVALGAGLQRPAALAGLVAGVGADDTITPDVSNDILRRQVTIMGSWTFSTVGQSDCARQAANRDINLGRSFTLR
jgi:hypothetical protein